MKTEDPPKPDPRAEDPPKPDPTADLERKLQAAKPYVLAVVKALLSVAIEQGAKIRAEARAKMLADVFDEDNEVPDQDETKTRAEARAKMLADVFDEDNEVPDHDENETKTTTQAPPERDVSG